MRLIEEGLVLEKEDINIRYEHQNNSNYLVIEDSSEYEDYQYKMLKRNNPEHFLHFSMYSVNGRYGIYYDITSRQQLSKYYEYGKMTMEDVKSICVNISEMVRIAEDYMLDIDHVKIEPRYIYMDVGTKKLQFVYHTRLNNHTFNESLKILFEFILEHFDHSLDKESIVKLYEVYQKVIVGDYDPYNLMRMFGVVTRKKPETDNISDNTSDNIENNTGNNIESNNMENHNRSVEKKQIKTVMPEQIVSDVEEKSDKHDAKNVRIIIAAVLIISGMINLLVPGVIPYNIPSIWSFIGIGAGVGMLTSFKKGKIKRGRTVVVSEKQAIPYSVKADVKEERRRAQQEEHKKEQKENEISYDDICNETMLLSDYMPEINKKKTLNLILQDEELVGDIRIYIRGIQNADNVIHMDKYPYVLGSFDKMSDVVIKAQVVSRMHCCIYHEEFKDDKYFVEDLNATNGTYLNGERLGNHEKKELHNGDILKLAAISFIVEII